MRLVYKVLKKMLILVAAPWLWFWTHYYFTTVQSRSTNKFKKSLRSGRMKTSRFPIPVLLVVILLKFSITGSAQQYIELVRVNTNYTSLNSFNDSERTSVISEIDVDLTLPVVLNEKLTLITGLMGETFRADLYVTDFTKSFYLLGPKAGINIKHSENGQVPTFSCQNLPPIILKYQVKTFNWVAIYFSNTTNNRI